MDWSRGLELLIFTNLSRFLAMLEALAYVLMASVRGLSINSKVLSRRNAVQNWKRIASCFFSAPMAGLKAFQNGASAQNHLVRGRCLTTGSDSTALAPISSGLKARASHHYPLVMAASRAFPYLSKRLLCLA